MTKIRTALLASAAFAALAFSGVANAADCYGGEHAKVTLRFPVTAANVPIPGINLNTKMDACAVASKPDYTIDGMPGSFTSKDAAAAFVKTALSMDSYGTAFKSTEELARAIAFILDLDAKFKQSIQKTADSTNVASPATTPARPALPGKSMLDQKQ